MKKLMPVLFFLLALNSYAQKLVQHRDKIDTAEKNLADALDSFSTCLVSSDLNICISNLMKSAKDPYEKYLAGGTLFEIDKDKSYQLHREAYEAEPNDLDFNLEYAIDLQRQGKYAEAAKIYEDYLEAVPGDIRVYTWLSDCYINTGDIAKAIKNWNLSDHASNHVSIDDAINIIYGSAEQVKARDQYRKGIGLGDHSLFYPLIFLDMNWQQDWWNSDIQEYFLAEDMALAEENLNKHSEEYQLLDAYIKIKRQSQTRNDAPMIKKLLTDNKLIVGNYPVPAYGKIASDILQKCFVYNIIDEKEFYETRGKELYAMAQKNKDAELLNIYAYLQAAVNQKVDSTIDKMGWKDYHEERFAVSYFIGKADSLKSTDAELVQALKDFPLSSMLYSFKVICAKSEHLPVKNDIIEMIRLEFKNLGSDPDQYSYALNSYFGLLEGEK